MSRNVEVRPSDIAAPFCSLTAAIQPLNGFLSVCSWLGDVEAVDVTELFQLLESAYLLGKLLAETDILGGHSHE